MARSFYWIRKNISPDEYARMLGKQKDEGAFARNVVKGCVSYHPFADGGGNAHIADEKVKGDHGGKLDGCAKINGKARMHGFGRNASGNGVGAVRISHIKGVYGG